LPPGLIKFEEFELDCARYELRHKGHALKLEKIPMELLMLLAAAEGRLVSREEIEERLWGGGVFVDTEHGINTAIRKIRQVFDDDPEHPRFVQTVQRKGYRFIADVTKIQEVPSQNNGAAKGEDSIASRASEQSRVSPSEHGTPEAEDETVPVRTTSRRLVWIGIAAAILLSWPVYKFVRPRIERQGPQAVAIRSLAVLPLENISGNASEEYFADGMTDELITMLAKYRSLRVISRTSVMQYKKVHRPLPEIARELGVDGIVEGSVVRSNDRVRVTAQLVYALTDTHLWAESYDRDLGDTLALQQELARSIAERVKLASSPPEASPSSVLHPVNTAAHDAYLRGRFYWFSGGYEKSRGFFQEAIQLDPVYAAAYSGLADSYTAAAVSGEISSVETMPRAETATRKALELDDLLPEAHNSLAAVKLFYRWDWEGAEKESVRAIELNPSFAEAHHLHAYVLETNNHTEEALKEDKLAVELDPFPRLWAYGYALIRARRFDEALKEFGQRSDARPDSGQMHVFLSNTYSYKGDYARAMDELRKALVIGGEESTARAVDEAYRKGGFRAVNLEFLMRLKRQATKEYVSPLRMAEVALGAGHREEAIQYLEQAFHQRDPQLVHMQHNPRLDSLHSDPRYWAIVKKMGMPPLQ
jgi:TolB-like protein/DNA-binding winged helix-turn-helix (wHTH) protein/Tfp pilus assembly protein PilF